MNWTKIINRLLFFPAGILKGIAELANNKARDIENRKRFPSSVVEKNCTFSDDTVIGKFAHILSGCIINHSEIGSYSYINRNSFIQHSKIGNYCSISTDVIIGPGAHPLDLFSTSPLFYKARNTFKINVIGEDCGFAEYKEITIGHDVWVGTRAVVMDGISIGSGAVIAAGAVVTKDVPAYAIVAGIPARIIRYRFAPDTRNELLKTDWWSHGPEQIAGNRKILDNIAKGDKKELL